MAVEYFVREIPTPGRATTDLRGHQWKAVRFNANGVYPATLDPGSGGIYVLHNKPNSGQACTVVAISNISKAYAGDTINVNDTITCNASQWFISTSAQGFGASSMSVLNIGTAFEGCSSGSVFPLYVRG